MGKYAIFGLLGLALAVGGVQEFWKNNRSGTETMSGGTEERPTGEKTPLPNAATTNSVLQLQVRQPSGLLAAGLNPSGLAAYQNNLSGQSPLAKASEAAAPAANSTQNDQSDNSKAQTAGGKANPAAPMTSNPPLVTEPTPAAKGTEVAAAAKNNPEKGQPEKTATERIALQENAAEKLATSNNDAAADPAAQPAPALPAKEVAANDAPINFTVLKPLPPDRTELCFPENAVAWTTYQVGTGVYQPLDNANPPAASVLSNNQVAPATLPNRNVTEPAPRQTAPVATAPSLQQNSEDIKAASRESNVLLRGAQLAFQNDRFPAQNRLTGQNVALEDVLRIGGNREKRLALTKAYWTLAVAMAEYHWATEEFYQLQQTSRANAGAAAPASETPQQRYIAAAVNAAFARMLETKATAITAQHELAALMGNQQSMPIALDVPLIGTYFTRIDEIFPDRKPPGRLAAIAATVDLRRDTINSRAYAIDSTTKAFDAALNEYVRRQAEAQFVVLAFEQLVRHRRAFLGAVRDYNFDVAEYTLNVIDGAIAPDELAARLTRSPNRPQLKVSATLGDNVIVTARQPTPAEVDDRGVRQATFVEATGDGWGQTADQLKSVMKNKHAEK